MPQRLPVRATVHPQYRADIDGLRAIAVLLVVMFHAFPTLIPAGFIGVDIFFVISGYLISTIIISSLEFKNFSFTTFYGRRIRRIFPALLLVLTISLAFGWFALLADEYKQLGKHVAGGAGFISNILLLNESGYFDNASETKPLLHLWSLGVEEQFYVIWPLVLWFAWKLRINMLLVMVAMAIASFSLSIAMVHNHLATAFYAPYTRFWELMIGAILAHLMLHQYDAITKLSARFDEKKLSNGLSLSGLILIVIGVASINKHMIFPGWWALLPAFGAFFIIAAGARSLLNRMLLSSRPLVGLGLISFPLYLWHWPLLSYAHIICNGTPPEHMRISIVIVSVLLAWVTYRFIEKPVRYGIHTKRTSLILLGLMATIGAAGYICFMKDGVESRVHSFAKISRAASGDFQYPGDMKYFYFEQWHFYSKASRVAETTLFIGDSNIEHYFARIDELIKTKPTTTNSVIYASASDCLAISGVYSDSGEICSTMLDKSIDLAISRKEISTVVISNAWVEYFADQVMHYYIINHGEKEFIEKNNDAYRFAMSSLSRSIANLKHHGKRVILILNIPMDDALAPKSMIQRSMEHFPNMLSISNSSVTMASLAERHDFIRADLHKIAKDNGIEAIDPVDYLCKNGICSAATTDGTPMYKDNAHVSPFYIRYEATFIDTTVKPHVLK